MIKEAGFPPLWVGIKSTTKESDIVFLLLKGYIHKSSLTANFIKTYAYSSPSETIPLFEISFNSKIKQLFYNGQWAICEVNGVQYYIRSDKLSSLKHFKKKKLCIYQMLNLLF